MSAKHLKTILKDYLRGTNFRDINNTITIQKTWEKTVGKPITKNTEILSFNKGTIIIKVSNPVWRNEISLQKKSLLDKLKKTEPSLNIKEIVLK